MRICIIGDSITWGARLPFRIAWANILRNYLYQISNDSIDVYDLEIDGDTTLNVIKRFDTEMQARKPNMIIVAAGVNDSVFRIKNGTIVPEQSINEFKKNVQTIIDKAKIFTNHIYWVGLVKGDDSLTNPLPRSTTGKRYTQQRVRKFDKAIKEKCKQNKVKYIPLFTKLNYTDFSDGLHPNEQGHLKMFEYIKKTI